MLTRRHLHTLLVLLPLLLASIAIAKANDCISCHQNEYLQWQKSHHAKSMAQANADTVLGNFSQTSARHHGQFAEFSIEDKKYWAQISYGDKSTRYQVKYTFGFEPLQQYLVETEHGKLQVLPFAWDTRDIKHGGQHWIHLYDEEIKPNDRLHWLQPLQNWNGMCADCHSDGLVRNYDSANDSFNSQWAAINVNCMSCHDGLPPQHSEQDKTDKAGKTDQAEGAWHRTANQDTAHWQGEQRDNSLMDTCYACHSLRSPLTDGFSSNKAFLDQFTPNLLMSPLYYPDGQIRDEVYVYGSFQQSKMFQNGVNCIDCHQPHSMELKMEGNGLCLQCHSDEKFNKQQHHGHNAASSGAQCINCHMPVNTYMKVDDRRDHSFKIPRPHLSETLNTPNACTQCHDNKTNQWAADNIKKWSGTTKRANFNLHNYWQIQATGNFTTQPLLAVAADKTIAPIVRATALAQLNYATTQVSGRVLKPYIEHDQPLIRLAAAQIGRLIAPQERLHFLSPLLTDPLKAVRIASVNQLLDVSILPQQQAAFESAFKELASSNEISSWRGEGRINQANLYQVQGQLEKSEDAYLAAILIDPYFEAAYVNIADLYRLTKQPVKAQNILEKGIKALPDSGFIHYSYGLYFVRHKQLSKATEQLAMAVKLAPDDPQFAYLYILVLDAQGDTQKALSILQRILPNYENSRQLKQLLKSLAAK